MKRDLDEFTKNNGLSAAKAAVDSYRENTPNFDESWSVPMHYASGFAAGHLALAISKHWIKPLQRQARLAVISALASLMLFVFAIFYVWSLVDFTSFGRFLIAFSPAVAALLFSVAKSYKSWADARKSLAEAKAISTASNSE